LWRVNFFDRAEVTSSPVCADGLVIISAEGPGIAAVDIAKRAVIWEDSYQAPGVGTPMVVGELLFAGLDHGGIVCRNIKTGKIVWEVETDEGFYASPILVGDRIYLIDRLGLTHIFEAKDKFNLIGKGKIDEREPSTPAIYRNRIYTRGKKHLYCIGS
jgi:outer membrane protein assembly factor BamB